LRAQTSPTSRLLASWACAAAWLNWSNDQKKGAGPTAPRLLAKIVGLVASAGRSVPSGTPAVKTTFAALFSGTSFVDGEIAAVEISAVECIDRVLRLFRGTHGDETKAARAARVAVHHEVCLGNGAMRREGVLEIVFGRVEREVSNE